MSKRYSGRIHDPNHTRDEYDLYFNDELITEGISNYAANADIAIGGIDQSNGQNNSRTNRLRTDNFIPITSGNYNLTTNNGLLFIIDAYDDNKSYLPEDSYRSFLQDGTTFTINQTVKYIRIVLSASPEVDPLTPDYASGLNIQEV